MYYSSVGVLSLILHMIINADTMFVRHKDSNTEVNDKYRSFLFGIIIYYVSDCLWGTLLDTGAISLVYIDTVVYFLAMGLTVFMWVRYIAVFLNQNEFWTKMLNLIGGGIFGLEAVALVINFFKPVMFHFNSEGEYVTGGIRYAILYIQVVLFVVIALDTLYTSTKMEKADMNRYRVIGVSGLVMALFVFLQAKFPMMPFYAMGCLIATTTIHTFVVVEDRVETSTQLGMVMTVAYKDGLTNVRNINAYTESKSVIEDKVKKGIITEFAVAVFDLNDLKYVNDTKGHEAGDKYIQDGCKLICTVFEHSPVFRIGGDEFVAFLTSDDYSNRDNLFREFNLKVDYNLLKDGVVVAAGISLYDPKSDKGYDDVFARADDQMYQRKKELKERKLLVKK